MLLNMYALIAIKSLTSENEEQKEDGGSWNVMLFYILPCKGLKCRTDTLEATLLINLYTATSVMC